MIIDLDFKQLRLDWGFMVNVAQASPGMKPYLKGYHLSLEMWRGRGDSEGWKVCTRPEQENHKGEGSMEASELDNDDDIKLKLTMLMLVEGELQG